MKRMLLAGLTAGVLALGLAPMTAAADTVDLGGKDSTYWCSATHFDDAKCKAAEAAEKAAAAETEKNTATLTDEQRYCDINSAEADVAKCNALNKKPAPEVKPTLTDEQKYCNTYIDGKPNPDANVEKCNALNTKPAPEVKPTITDEMKYCFAYIDGKFNPDADVEKCNALSNKQDKPEAENTDSALVQKYCYAYIDGKFNPDADVEKCKLAEQGIDPDAKDPEVTEPTEEDKTPAATEETKKDSDKTVVAEKKPAKVAEKKGLANTGASVGLMGGAAALLTLAGGAAALVRKNS